MEIYIIKVNLSLILFYLCYKLLFQRDTFWMLRRVYLLVSILFSFIYPLISVEGWIRKQEPIMIAIASIQMDEFVITPGAAQKLSFFTLENVLWILFGFVAMLMLLRFSIQLFAIIKRRIQGEKIILQEVPVIRLKEKLMPFSFFRWIFINPFLHNHIETAEILEHEQTHVRQWHSLDIIIGQVQTILCWFNPAAWLLNREIRINLEFLADNQVIKSGFEPKKYQYHLLSLTYEPADSKLGNQFNVSPIKKRIKMMNARKTKKRGLLKYALIIPIALVMLVVSNMQEMIAATRTFVEKVVVTENVLSEAELNLDAELQQQKNKVKFTEPVITRDEDVKIYDMVEEAPSFPGGVTELYNWLGQNIVYPVEAQEKGIQGRVTIQFVITETGKVLQPKVVRSLDPLLDAEAIRVVNTMPDWIPGKQGGKAVNVRYTLPVQFKLVDNEPKMTPVEVVLIKKEVVSIKKDDELSNKNVYDMVDTPPVFPGGEMELYKWLSENIVYPVEAQEKGIQGRVTIQFVITETGKIIQPKVVRSLDPLLDAEAIRVVNTMPDWTPGKHEGKNVRVNYVLPVGFKLQDNKTTVYKENESKNMLIVLDGKEITHEQLSKINQEDIREVSVLKGKSATELYGEKGKHGVVLIKLK